MKNQSKHNLPKWIFTILFTLPLLGSGIVYLIPAHPIIVGMAHLGYPEYLTRFLGVAKVLGCVAILLGAFPRIKEWAYAGFTFDLLGAAYSHLCSGDGPKAFAPLVVLLFGILSYFFWRKSSCAKCAVGQCGESAPFN